MDRKTPGKFIYPLLAIYGFLFLPIVRSVGILVDRGNLVWTGEYLFTTFLLAILGAALGVGVGFGTCKILTRASGREAFYTHRGGEGIQALVTLLCIVGWLPYYAAYYPGICAYDSYIQIGQVVSGNYTDHHPIAHTLLLKVAMALGTLIKEDVNVGIGIYSLLQLLLLAVVCGSAVRFGYERIRKPGAYVFAIVATLYLSLFPFHGFLAVSVTKDIPFTICLLWLLLHLVEFAETGRKKLGILISGILMVLFRNNGKYTLAFLLGVILLCLLVVLLKKSLRKKYAGFFSKLTLLLAGAILGGSLLGSVLFSATEAVQGDRREMLSLPIQQLSRVMLYHGGVGALPEDDGSLDPDSKALICAFLGGESYLEYRQDIADPVKRHVNTSVALQQAPDFVSTYVKLFFRYPQEYINAFLAVNAGFLSPFEESHAAVNLSDTLTGLGYVQTRWQESDLNAYGVYRDSKWTKVYEKSEVWASENAYLQVPVLKYLVMPGIYLWLVLLSLIFAIGKKDWRGILPAILLLGYYATMLLGPTVQLRYVYPVMLAWPLVLLGRGTRKKCYFEHEGKVENLPMTEEEDK